MKARAQLLLISVCSLFLPPEISTRVIKYARHSEFRYTSKSIRYFSREKYQAQSHCFRGNSLKCSFKRALIRFVTRADRYMYLEIIIFTINRISRGIAIFANCNEAYSSLLMPSTKSRDALAITLQVLRLYIYTYV